MAITTCIFDAYGTLFDVAAAARQAATEPDYSKLRDKWPELANHWRLKQLQYTWLRAITDAHTDFWEVTQDGLDWALEATGLDGDPARVGGTIFLGVGSAETTPQLIGYILCKL